MITPNPLVGTGLHALGGISASTCYLPSQGLKKWSWGTFWIVQACFAWFIMPAFIGFLTVPGFQNILVHAPSKPFWMAFGLGAVYGFGGMCFGLSIKHIGYSLTYTIAIGISAVLGTIIPLMVFGGLTEYFKKPGGNIVLSGMVLSVIGVAICGLAGFKKEKDLRSLQGASLEFKMLTGLLLAVVAGVLSGIFNVSLEFGQPIADIAAQNGAGQFEGNAKLIVSTSGCLVVNLVWFVVAGVRNKTLKEFTSHSGLSLDRRLKNGLWSALAGSLWTAQFFFYGLGHVKMGNFQFASWVLHMSMLIFFSYIVGVIMKEWKSVRRDTYGVLVVGLVVLIVSFIVTAYGSVYGESVLRTAG